ncbi:ABC transporter ATP-binding protein [Actinomyces timonensis]|uniref:ABC transporter ATP-binding protein n=1 Tax=Actinomyces timonensis TaxID=1288391 RepID=A0AAU8N3H4_9ACTO
MRACGPRSGEAVVASAGPSVDAAPALRLDGLTKRYGERAVVDHLDLSVPEGSIFGFLGRNGAGKTTTIRMVLGLSAPTSGSVSVLGRDTPRALAAGGIGYLPDAPGFHGWMRADEVLDHAARLAGLDAALRHRRARGLLALAGLEGVTQPTRAYSRGMRQRLGLARALISAPRLLIMDEPTSALDPVGRRELLDLIASLRGRTTVLLSTHLLDDAERVCDRVAIIDAGRLVLSGRTEEVTAGTRATSIELRTAADAAPLAGILRRQEWVSGVEADAEEARRIRVRTPEPETAHLRLPGLLAEAGCGLVSMAATRHGLEEAFLRAVGEDAHDGPGGSGDGVGAAAPGDDDAGGGPR